MRILLDEDLPRRLCGLLVIGAVSNRMEHLLPLVAGILQAIEQVPPQSLRRVDAG